MTNRDYKEGFDGGIDFALTFVGQAYGTKFADLNELVAFIERTKLELSEYRYEAQELKAALRTVQEDV